jgi:hypothetical protein
VPDDTLPTALAEIRELLAERERITKRMKAAPLSIEVFNEVQDKLADKWLPRLLGAVDKVLKAADRWQLYAAEGDAADECAGDVRRIIARALAGKGNGD